MTVLKAIGVGVVTGLLAPVVAAIAQWAALAAGFVGRIAATGGGGGPSSFDVYMPTSWSIDLLRTQMAVGFIVGFVFYLWNALARSPGRR